MINLLPPQTKEAIKYARRNVTMIQYVALVVLVAFAIISTLMFGQAVISRNEADIKTSIENSQSKITELEKVNEEAEELSSTIETISTLLASEVKFSELLTEIGSLLPSGTVLTNLAVSDDRSEPIILDTNVTNETASAILRENLSDSDLFTSADIISITLVDDPGSIYKFSARLQAYFAPNVTEQPPSDEEAQQ